MQRQVLLEDKKSICQQDQVPLVLEYNIQYRKIESIIYRHWHILKSDRGLKEILPEKPQFIYKRAPTLRDWLVKSVIDPPRAFTPADDAMPVPTQNVRTKKCSLFNQIVMAPNMI